MKNEIGLWKKGSFLWVAFLGLASLGQAGTLYHDDTLSPPSLGEAPSTSASAFAQMVSVPLANIQMDFKCL